MKMPAMDLYTGLGRQRLPERRSRTEHGNEDVIVGCLCLGKRIGLV